MFKSNTYFNWNKSIKSTPKKIYYPRTYKEIKEIINSAKTNSYKVRVVGKSRHVFSNISSSDINTYVINTKYLNKIIELNSNKMYVRVQSGCSLRVLNNYLNSYGYALDNMGGIDKQAIGGLIGTATHGSSIKYGTISDLVMEIKLIDANSNILIINNEHEYFNAVKCNLGALGIILEVSVKITKKFNLKQQIINIDTLNTNDTNTFLNNNDYAEIQYFANINKYVLRTRNRTYDFNEKTLGKYLDIIKDDISSSVMEGLIKTMQLIPASKKSLMNFAHKYIINKRSGPSHQIFISNDIHGTFNVTNVTDQEYAFPIENIVDVFNGLLDVLKTHDVAIVGSIRFAPASCAYLGPSCDRATGYIDISILTKNPSSALLNDIDNYIIINNGRPHWGKRNNVTNNYVSSLYPMYNEFNRIRKLIDPHNMFINEYLDNIFN
jgi:FAD/FMN-containing dehydrogenase